MKLFPFIFIISSCLLVSSKKNCSKSFCRDDWRSVGRFCLKFDRPVKYFSEANELCKSYAGLNSNLFSKSLLIDTELQDLVNIIHDVYPTKRSHTFWVIINNILNSSLTRYKCKSWTKIRVSPNFFYVFKNNGKMYIFGKDPNQIEFTTYTDFNDYSCISPEFCGGQCIGNRKYSNMLFMVTDGSFCLKNAPDGNSEYPVICQYVRYENSLF